MDSTHIRDPDAGAGTNDISTAAGTADDTQLPNNDPAANTGVSGEAGDPNVQAPHAGGLGSMDSAGLPFQGPWNAENGLIDTVRQQYPRGQNTTVRGFVQETGNTCYRNSLIVSLVNSQRFMSYVTNWHMQHENAFRTQNQEQNEFLILHALHRLGRAYWTSIAGNHHDESMRRFFDGCNNNTDGLPQITGSADHTWTSWAKRSFQSPPRIQTLPNTRSRASGRALLTLGERVTTHQFGHQQQDVHEFFLWLMEAINRQLVRDTRWAARPLTDQFTHTQPQENFNCIFRVRQNIRNACPACQHPVWDRRNVQSPNVNSGMQLVIPEHYHQNDIHSLLDVVRVNTSDVISNTTCERCGNQSDIRRRFTFQSLPEVLFLNLDRTAYDAKGGSSKKIHRVLVPEDLDLSQWLEHHEYGEGSKVRYRLSSIIAHSGPDTHSGHYIAIVRGGQDGQRWYRVDDDTVTPTTLAQWDDSARSMTTTSPWTPGLMVYEKVEEIQNPGRPPRNLQWVDDTKPPAGIVTAPARLARPEGRASTSPDRNRTPRTPSPQAQRTPSRMPPGAPGPSPQGSDAASSLFTGSPRKNNTIDTPHSDAEHSDDDGPDPLWPGAGTLSAHTCAPETDKDWAQAELYIKVKVGSYDFDFPRRILQHFNPLTKRELKIEAVLKGVNAETQEEMYLELMDAENSAKKRWRRKPTMPKRAGAGQRPKPVFSKVIKPQRLRPKLAPVQAQPNDG